jgi:hypothetical protein
MAKHNYQSQIHWSRIIERLVYLPGALILGYGLWLTLLN